MTNALLERGRRAVYHSLSRVLSDQAALWRAFDVWEQGFAHRQGFRVNLYVNALAEARCLEQAKLPALSAALYSAMTLPEEKLPQLPPELRTRRVEPPLTAAAKRPSPQPRADAPHLAIFSSLMAALVESVGRMHKLDEFLAALHAQQPILSQSTLRARAAWINGALADMKQFADSVQPLERRSVLNDLYLALCAACGRADADAVLAVAVHATEQVADVLAHPSR